MRANTVWDRFSFLTARFTASDPIRFDRPATSLFK